MAARKEFDLNLKLLLIGDSDVGKTHILLRYAQGTYSETFITTIGIDYKYKFINLSGRNLRLEIWDTSGQERFKAVTRSYLRGAMGLVLCYNVHDEDSLRYLEDFLLQITAHTDTDVPRVLLGITDKMDYGCSRRVAEEEGRSFAAKHNMCFFEVSTASGESLSTAFEALVRMVMQVHFRPQRRVWGRVLLQASEDRLPPSVGTQDNLGALCDFFKQRPGLTRFVGGRLLLFCHGVSANPGSALNEEAQHEKKCSIQ